MDVKVAPFDEDELIMGKGSRFDISMSWEPLYKHKGYLPTISPTVSADPASTNSSTSVYIWPSMSDFEVDPLVRPRNDIDDHRAPALGLDS